MNDLEQRLRTAMTAAAEPAPSGLMDEVRRRRHRHRRRLMTGSAAVVAAIGLAGLLAALQQSASGRSGAVAGSMSPARLLPAVRPGAGNPGLLPWWATTESSHCGPPARVRFGEHVQSVGDCAGLLVVPALQVTLHVGQQIDVHMTEEPRDPHGRQMAPLIPLPGSSRPSVVLAGPVSADRATGIYLAVRPGQAVLASRTGFCLESSVEKTGNCPVVQITVVP